MMAAKKVTHHHETWPLSRTPWEAAALATGLILTPQLDTLIALLMTLCAISSAARRL